MVAFLTVQPTRQIATEDVLNVSKFEFALFVLHGFHFVPVDAQLGYLSLIKSVKQVPQQFLSILLRHTPELILCNPHRSEDI